MVANKISVEVVYLKPDGQYVLSCVVPFNATIEEVITLSGILNICPEINLEQQKIGIFGKIKLLSDRVQAFDRVEIYRALTIDPKEARRKRGKESKNLPSP